MAGYHYRNNVVHDHHDILMINICYKILPLQTLHPFCFFLRPNNIQSAKDQYCCELFSGVGEVAGGFRAMSLK